MCFFHLILRVLTDSGQCHNGVGGRVMLGIHFKIKVPMVWESRAFISDPRSAATSSWVTTPVTCVCKWPAPYEAFVIPTGQNVISERIW